MCVVKYFTIQLPGKAAGNAKMGMAIMKHKTAAARKPIHHAPTHTLLFGVKPILEIGSLNYYEYFCKSYRVVNKETIFINDY